MFVSCKSPGPFATVKETLGLYYNYCTSTCQHYFSTGSFRFSVSISAGWFAFLARNSQEVGQNVDYGQP